MVATLSGANRYPSAAYATMPAGAGAFGAVLTAASGTTNYDPEAARWGDYSWAVIDPSGKSVWLATEYVPPSSSQTPDGRRDWGTGCSRCRLAERAQRQARRRMTANIAFSLCAGAVSLAVVILAAVKGDWTVAAVYTALVLGFLARASYGRRDRSVREEPPDGPAEHAERRLKAARFRRRWIPRRTPGPGQVALARRSPNGTLRFRGIARAPGAVT